jgi:hypothetical protein
MNNKKRKKKKTSSQSPHPFGVLSMLPTDDDWMFQEYAEGDIQSSPIIASSFFCTICLQGSHFAD